MSWRIDPGKEARILDSAERLFRRYGVKRTSIEDVAREAGIAKGTFYLYYSSKEELFTARPRLLERIPLVDRVARAQSTSDRGHRLLSARSLRTSPKGEGRRPPTSLRLGVSERRDEADDRHS